MLIVIFCLDFLAIFRNNAYICSLYQNRALMNKETMTKLIADYFKTQPILKAWLFGSFSQGEQCEDSDVDILVVYDKSQPIGLFKIASMNVDLEDILGRQVDLVEEKSLFPWVVDSVMKDGKLIYERAA